MNDFIEYCLNRLIPNSTTKNLFSTNNPIVFHVRHVPNAEESQGQNTFPSVLGLELPPLTPQLLVRSATPNGVVEGKRNKNQQQQWHIPPDPVSAKCKHVHEYASFSLAHT